MSLVKEIDRTKVQERYNGFIDDQDSDSERVSNVPTSLGWFAASAVIAVKKA
jgi:hypothetical protein